MMSVTGRLVVCGAVLGALSIPAHCITLKDAVRQTIQNHPSISAARANRIATGYELKQAQGRFLPRIDLNAEVGAQWIDRPNGLSAARNKKWRAARQVGVSINQFLFDGWDRSNDLYRSAARIDAASLRVLQRSEVLALQAVEAYIDVRRHAGIYAIAKANVRRHQRILSQVSSLVNGGKAPRSDIGQTVERVAAAKAVAAQVEQALLEAKAKFKQVIGLRPGRLFRVRIPRNMPRNRRIALQIALANNPSIRALAADTDVAKFTRKQAKSDYWPKLSLQGSATAGHSRNGTPGRDNELAGKVVLSWNLFNGGITSNKVKELNARLGQSKHEYALQARKVGEAVERAYAAYVVGAKRVRFANQQVNANRRVVNAYLEEYKLSKRSLLDVLDAERALFNSRFQSYSLSAVHIFASYQLLGNMGKLLKTFNVSAPREAVGGYRVRARKNIFNIDIPPLRQ